MSALLESLLPRECRAECAKNEAAARAAKRGCAADRAECAKFAREQRAMYAEHGALREDTNLLVQIATHNRLARMTAARKSIRSIDAEVLPEVRAIVAQPLQLSPQDRALAEGFAGARPFDPWGQREADRAQSAELNRMPLGGFLA